MDCLFLNINSGNDLVGLMQREGLKVSEDNTIDTLYRMAEELLVEVEDDAKISERCRKLFERLFSAETAVRQIVSALEEGV